MNILWGIVITLISAIGLIGQLLAAIRPATAQKLGFMERESEVDPVFFADVKAEAVWDSIILWLLPLAGILLTTNQDVWVYFGLVGGGMYVYFAGRGILSRITLLRRKIRIGKKNELIGIFVFLGLWGLVGFLAIMLAILDLAN